MASSVPGCFRRGGYVLGWTVTSEAAALWQEVPAVATDPAPDQKPAARNRKPAARNRKPAAPDQKPAAPDQKPAAPDQKPAAPGERRPVAMTPYAIAVALFAAFVVGGILAKAVPLWLVAVIGLAIGAAVFVFVDRYPRLPRSQ
jgi:Flp pilus assembly protein TadB